MHNHSSDSSTDNDKKTKVSGSFYPPFLFEKIGKKIDTQFLIEKNRSISLVRRSIDTVSDLSRLISACETDSSQAAIEYASEHSNHGKHCHHKIEHIIEQHSKQNHSHDT